MGNNTKSFSEKEIRPVVITKEQKAAFSNDVSFLLSRKKNFVEVNCPACDSDKYFKTFEKNGFEYVLCQTCETMFMNPRPSPEILDAFYKTSENYAYWNKHIFPVSEKVRREQIFKPRVDSILSFCNKYSVKTNSLLEIGAGFGTLCEEMGSRKIFKKIVAIEPTPNLAKTCREKHIETIEDTIENIEFNSDEKFDVTLNFEVIEHLFSPKNFILKCKSFLNPNGLLILTCPNYKGFDFVVLGSSCKSIDHEHLNYFSPSSLKKLLENCGFDILEALTPGKLDAELVRNQIISGDFDIANQPFLKQILIDNWEKLKDNFQDFISSNGLSSHLWVIARLK